MGANGPDKLVQGHNGRFADITVRFCGGLPDVRCAAQRHHRARIKRYQQQAENACTMRAGLAVPIEPIGRSCCDLFLSGADSPVQGVEDLPCVVEVTVPEHRDPL